MSGYRALVSRAANQFMRFVFPVPHVRDFSCGFRVYRAQVVQDAVAFFGRNFIQLRGLGFTSTLAKEGYFDNRHFIDLLKGQMAGRGGYRQGSRPLAFRSRGYNRRAMLAPRLTSG